MHATLTAVAILTLTAHAAVEGSRIQMIPTYALVTAMIAVAATRTRWTVDLGANRRSLKIAACFVLAAWVAIAATAPSAFPVFRYEHPTGRYAIGTAVYELKHGPGGRDLVIQTWYPAAAGVKGATAGITTHPLILERAYASFTELPRPLFDSLRLVKTHAIIDAPLASETQRFPVVLFSHGPLGANRSQSIFQMEALASSGFVVVAIDHTGYASTTIFPDGRAIPPGPDATWPVFVDQRSTAMLHTWVADVRFVLDQLERLNTDDRSGLLVGRLDLARVGYVGASFGGSVVVQALLDEPRIKAGVAEDGKPYFSDSTLTTLQRPLMYMQSAAPYIRSTDAQLARWGLTSVAFRTAEQDHYARQMQLFGAAASPIYNVYIRGTNHLTFSDLNLIIRIPDSGVIDIRRAHMIINVYTVAFFDRYLNGASPLLVDGHTPSPYEEVTVAARNIPTSDEIARFTRDNGSD